MDIHTRAIARACTPVLLALLAWASAASAQSLPRPAEFYFDEDASVAAPLAREADGADVEQLVRLMERGGRNAEQATAQLAHLSMASGRAETGRALYARAIAQAQEGSARRRMLQWNQGWDLYRAGDLEAALGSWGQAYANRLVHPSWVPPTLALALWKLDRRDEAVAWYAAAVRTYPDRWSNPAALPALLPDWTEADRTTLAEVVAAWREAPPAWP
ncbi:tetratricopeptide repeat protein [Luteimonas sp. M1R5S18]|jgi:tetratricopeptide (TPR) repeat protein|uniref:Tetratricopeptide repeat protein n=1 Tax=Luteimonas rhizosphaericola TaxID=3042024 RepID=A0ABT6JE81_9GAMM|nr:tetratricopeptide repeat protein [Luteimonas rhizosphaericola]MDH5828978.1 tetratricopeptide repeat protein [Luteimonas rhizosphaericola]